MIRLYDKKQLKYNKKYNTKNNINMTRIYEYVKIIWIKKIRIKIYITS